LFFIISLFLISGSFTTKNKKNKLIRKPPDKLKIITLPICNLYSGSSNIVPFRTPNISSLLPAITPKIEMAVSVNKMMLIERLLVFIFTHNVCVTDECH